MLGDLPDSPGAGSPFTRVTYIGTEATTVAVTALTPVIPRKSYQKNRLTPITEPRVPEPIKLYCLISLTFALHVPATTEGICGQCGVAWPCPQVRLAFRLREGF
jgi:hypothetical protein